ncbi:MAG: L,D-transpeptidase [Hyphomicrobiales bacterium]|nr:L,D-transpeptidase [Hyphomicrobiales bacterium]MCP5000818.1 L,D-transpeptidase [Hyphomicrobiales bacterium]
MAAASAANAFMRDTTLARQDVGTDVVTVAAKRPKPQYMRKKVRITTRERPGTIIIDTSRKYLYYIEGNGRATRYGVGVGREGFGWAGTVKVGRKAEWPDWRPPKQMIARERKKGRIIPPYMKGGINNPLGARALYLHRGGRDTIYRIHGTNQPWTIGQNMSSGCIRMMNKDVKHLYRRAGVGSKVIVIGPNGNSSRYYQERGIDILATIFRN